MFKNRNLSGRHSAARIVGGCLLLAGGLAYFQTTLPGLILAGTGAVGIVSGVVGYCPACALAGRGVHKGGGK